MVRRIQVAMLALLFVSGALLVRAQNPPDHLSPNDEAAHWLLILINHERIQRGLRPLQWDAGLAASAHARLTATQSAIPDTSGSELAKRAAVAGVSFSGIVENVVSEGQIASAADIRWGNVEWMELPRYRANVLDPSVDLIGIAAEIREGTVSVVEDFAHSIEPLSLVEQENRVAEKVRAYDDGPRSTARRVEDETCQREIQRGLGCSVQSAAGQLLYLRHWRFFLIRSLV
jgi:hypothetical protein